MPQRNIKFYSEVVLVTVLSLVAANAWVRWMSQSLNYDYPKSLKVDFIVAVVTTCVAVWILHAVFAEKKNGEKSPYEEKNGRRPEVRHDVYSTYSY